jgi:acetylglutamate kinase
VIVGRLIPAAHGPGDEPAAGDRRRPLGFVRLTPSAAERTRAAVSGLIKDVAAEDAGSATERARVLAQALPFLRRYAGATIVVKYGGHAMGEEHLAAQFGSDVALLKQVGVNPVVVHGGGPQINAMLKRLAIQSTFVDGLRVTDSAMVEVVEMVLAGTVNKYVASLITRAGALAVGVSGKDGGMIRARKLRRTKKDPGSNIERVLDLGFVGEPEHLDVRVIHALTGAGLVPVIAPVGVGADGQTYNINADTVAGAVAGGLCATRLLMLTDVPGVLDNDGRLIPELTIAEAEAGIASGMISGGMIPKVENCIDAVQRGAKGAVILDGRVPHACLLELFTEAGPGTIINP